MNKIIKILFVLPLALFILFLATMIIAFSMAVSAPNASLSNYYDSIEWYAGLGVIISVGITLLISFINALVYEHNHKKKSSIKTKQKVYYSSMLNSYSSH
ncbi:MAG: hypothetical protein QXO65_03605 [Candidatus Aenigmatarchaeota archaeon]